MLRLDHRVTGFAPKCSWVVEHEQNHQRHQLSQQLGAVAQLGAIDTAFPRGAAMDQLVAQGIDAAEHLMVIDIGGIGGVEGDPEEDETTIHVLRL